MTNMNQKHTYLSIRLATRVWRACEQRTSGFKFFYVGQITLYYKYTLYNIYRLETALKLIKCDAHFAAVSGHWE